MSARLVSRLSTLDAARAVFFIVVGLAIKQSLILLGHAWPPKDFLTAPMWPFWARAIIATGYLVTVIRFSHGVTLLYGHEKDRIENSRLPSASKISELSLFLVLLAIPLFLMADNVIETNSYIFWTAVLLVADFVYVLRSGVVRHPLKRVFRLLRETDRGYAAHAAFWWMATDLALLIACGLFFVRSALGTMLVSYPPSREIIFAVILILGAIADYWLNWDFYFGGRQDRRKQKFVFVLSPLGSSNAAVYKENIHRAQKYCLDLMNWQGRFGRRITPLATHAFFPYFLNNGVREDRALGVECTLAYLSACDAVYVYVPGHNSALKDRFGEESINQWGERHGLTTSLRYGFLNRFIDRLEKDRLTKGMKVALNTAKELGLDIKYLREISPLPSRNIWSRPNWTQLAYEREPIEKKPSQSYFKGAAQRKKVYVCTSFRGTGFARRTWQEKIQQLETNSKLALWHCHELVRDPDEAVAPFAPQAFYPYFWKFTNIDPDDPANSQIDQTKWDAWFDRSIEILKVCDAVYIYTSEGLPPSEEDCSEGVRKVDKTARKLGLEIQYRKELKVPDQTTVAEQARIKVEKAASNAVTAQQEADELQKTADSHEASLGPDNNLTQEAQVKAFLAKHNAKILRGKAEEAKREAENADLLKKRTWEPATPVF